MIFGRHQKIRKQKFFLFSKKIIKFLKVAKKKNIVGNDVKFLVQTKNDINDSYSVPAVPFFVVLDQNNIVREVVVGAGRNLEKAFSTAKSLLKAK